MSRSDLKSVFEITSRIITHSVWLVVPLLFVTTLCLLLLDVAELHAQEGNPEAVAVSPIEGWEDFSEDPEPTPWWRQALLWPINRVADLWDVFRVDAGVGPAIGAMARITEHGQFGARFMKPKSIRVGDFGRKEPYLVEKSDEYGIGPFLLEQGDREVCKYEIGLGLDLLFLGGYVGLCMEELYDFGGGLLLADPEKDDWR